MIKRAIILLSILSLFCGISIAKSNLPLLKAPGKGLVLNNFTNAATQTTTPTVWFSLTKAATPAGVAYRLAAKNNLNFTNAPHRDKNAERTLMALNFALGLQSIGNEYIRLPKIKVLLLQPLWKIMAYGLAFLFLLTVAIVMTVSNITQKKLNTRLKEYELQRETDLERQRISGELREEVIADLVRIAQMSETFSKQKTSGNVAAITQISNKIIDNISDINWCVQPANNTLNEFFPHLRESLYKLLRSTDIAFSILLPDSNGNTVLSIEQRRNMLLTVKEIVHNAIKYSQASEIIVKAVLMDKGVQFFINDNGVGFDVNSETSGTGIKNIQRNIANLNGRLTLTSEPKLGTYYTFFIPLKA